MSAKDKRNRRRQQHARQAQQRRREQQAQEDSGLEPAQPDPEPTAAAPSPETQPASAGPGRRHKRRGWVSSPTPKGTDSIPRAAEGSAGNTPAESESSDPDSEPTTSQAVAARSAAATTSADSGDAPVWSQGRLQWGGTRLQSLEDPPGYLRVVEGASSWPNPALPWLLGLAALFGLLLALASGVGLWLLVLLGLAMLHPRLRRRPPLALHGVLIALCCAVVALGDRHLDIGVSVQRSEVLTVVGLGFLECLGLALSGALLRRLAGLQRPGWGQALLRVVGKSMYACAWAMALFFLFLSTQTDVG